MIRQHIFRTILFAIIGLVLGFIYLSTAPKVYEGRTQLVIGTQAQNSGRYYQSNMKEDVAAILQAGLATNPVTEAQILRGEGVFRAAIEMVAIQANKPELRRQADELYDMYDVVGSPESSDVLVRARAYTPELATAIANAAAVAYNDRRQRTQRETVAEALTYLQNQITAERENLKQSETRFKEKKEELGLPDVNTNVGQDIEYQSQLRGSIDNAKAELAGAEKSIAELNSEIAAQPVFEAGEESEQKRGTLQALENQLAELERQRQAALVQYFEDSDTVKYLNASIASVKKQIADLKKLGFEDLGTLKRPNQIRKALESQLATTKVARQSIAERVRNLEVVYNNITTKLGQVPASVQDLTELARDSSLKEQNYRQLMIQYEDLKNRSETGVKPAGIVYSAIEDPYPVLPRPVLVYVVAILGGAILGLLVSFAVEGMRLRIYSSSQLQELTGLPVAGVVHDLPGPTARKLLTSVREPNPMISESYRFMAFSAMSNKGSGPKKILLTGIDNNAGCSTTAAQFATALAQAGSRVMLVDCALEDPAITKVFGLEQSSGVSDILGQTQLPQPDSIPGSDTATPNLRVLGAGTEGRSAIKVAASQNINGMIGALAGHCDLLVLDSMPCLSSSDAARLVPYVDEVYLVVNAKTANMRNVAAAIDVLTLASAASVKFIFTKGSRGEEAVMKQANLASVRV